MGHTRRAIILALLCAIAVLSIGLRARPAPAPIGFIGDSLSTWGGPSAPETASAILGCTAVDRAVSGTTSAMWTPAGRLLGPAIVAFHAAGVRVVSVALGTNDADNMVYPRPLVAGVHAANMAAIAAALRAVGFRVVVQGPPYLVPGAYKRVTAASDEALRAYGTGPAYAYFRARPDLYRDGIHMTQAGFDRLGAIWAAPLR